MQSASKMELNEFHFQQDNALCHVSKKNKVIFRSKQYQNY